MTTRFDTSNEFAHIRTISRQAPEITLVSSAWIQKYMSLGSFFGAYPTNNTWHLLSEDGCRQSDVMDTRITSSLRPSISPLPHPVMVPLLAQIASHSV